MAINTASALGLVVVDSEAATVVVDSGTLATVVELTGVGGGLVVEAGTVAVSSITAGVLWSGSGTTQADANSIRLSRVKRIARGPGVFVGCLVTCGLYRRLRRFPGARRESIGLL